MLREGDLAPSFELTNLSGGSWSLTRALASGPVLLVFFKISCETCQFTFPFLQRLASSTPADSMAIVAISQDDAIGTRQFHERFGISLPTLLDKPWAFPVSSAFDIAHVPSLFLVEPDGRISLAVEGFSKAHLEQLGARFHAVPFGPHERIPAMRPG